jgi:hypothetical protein
MIKQAVHEDELIYGMQRELQPHDKKQGMENLVKAADYLQAAMEIFEAAGLTAQSDKVLSILAKIATDEQDAKGKPRKPKNPTTVSDSHTQGLTPERMVENLKHHGIVFNMADDGEADDLLNVEVPGDKPLEVTEPHPSEKDFEDES